MIALIGLLILIMHRNKSERSDTHEWVSEKPREAHRSVGKSRVRVFKTRVLT